MERKRLTAKTLIPVTSENQRTASRVRVSKRQLEDNALKATTVAHAILGEKATEGNVEKAAEKILRASLVYPGIMETYDILASARPDFVALTKEEPSSQQAPSPDIGTEEGSDPASGGEESVHVHEGRPNSAVLDVITNETNPSTAISACKKAMTRLYEAHKLLTGHTRIASSEMLTDSLGKVAALVAKTKLKAPADEMMAAMKENKKDTAVKAMRVLYAGLRDLAAGFNLMTEMDIDKTKPAGWIAKQQATASKTAAEDSSTDEDEKDEESGKKAAKEEDAKDTEKKAANPPTSPIEQEMGIRDDESNTGDMDGGEDQIPEDDDDDVFNNTDDGDEEDDDSLDEDGDEDSLDEDGDEDQDGEEETDGEPGIDDVDGLQGIDQALMDSAPQGGPNQIPEGQDDDEQFFGDAGPAPALPPTGGMPTAGKRQSMKLPRGLGSKRTASSGENELDAVFGGGITAADMEAAAKEFEV